MLDDDISEDLVKGILILLCFVPIMNTYDSGEFLISRIRIIYRIIRVKVIKWKSSQSSSQHAGIALSYSTTVSGS